MDVIQSALINCQMLQSTTCLDGNVTRSFFSEKEVFVPLCLTLWFFNFALIH